MTYKIPPALLHIMEVANSRRTQAHLISQQRKKVEAPGPVLAPRDPPPLERLQKLGWLHDRLDDAGGRDAERRRVRAATSVRALFEGAQVTSLRTPDLDSIRSGFTGKTPTATAIDCMCYLDSLKASMPADDFVILDSMLSREDLVFPEGSGADVGVFRERCRRALDYAAIWPYIDEEHRRSRAQYWTERMFRMRWPDAPLPKLLEAMQAARVHRVGRRDG